jgi:hypothetical protein
MRYLNRAVAATTGAVLALGAAPVANAAGAPDWEAPFSCGTEWSAGTRDGHSPSWYSVDFNRTDDEGAPVLATAGGQVTAVRDVGDTSYGKYVIVDHGGGYTSLYAHLQVTWVVEGQWLDQGEFIGRLGNSGGTTGAHLHFEESYERVNQHAYFHGEMLEYGTTIVAVAAATFLRWATGTATGAPISARASPGQARRSGSFSPTVASTSCGLGAPTDVGVSGDWNGERGRRRRDVVADGTDLRAALLARRAHRGADGQGTRTCPSPATGTATGARGRRLSARRPGCSDGGRPTARSAWCPSATRRRRR